MVYLTHFALCDFCLHLACSNPDVYASLKVDFRIVLNYFLANLVFNWMFSNISGLSFLICLDLVHVTFLSTWYVSRSTLPGTFLAHMNA